MPDVAPRWRHTVHHIAEAARRLYDQATVPTDDQLLAQIEQESGGNEFAVSPASAIGLGQIVSQNHPHSSFENRPGDYWLYKPLINLGFQITMMQDGMALARGRKHTLRKRNGKPYGILLGPSQGDIWEHALLYYYSGSLNGWDSSYGGHSGADYVDAVRDKLPRYVRQTFERVTEERKRKQEGRVRRLRRLLRL